MYICVTTARNSEAWCKLPPLGHTPSFAHRLECEAVGRWHLRHVLQHLCKGWRRVCHRVPLAVRSCAPGSVFSLMGQPCRCSVGTGQHKEIMLFASMLHMLLWRRPVDIEFLLSNPKPFLPLVSLSLDNHYSAGMQQQLLEAVVISRFPCVL